MTRRRSAERRISWPAALIGACVFSGSVFAQGLPAQSLPARGLPAKEATCVVTRVKSVEHRLQSGADGSFVPDSGSAVVFENGGYQVSYVELPAVQRSRAGDAVTLCLIRLPRGCPAGDARGRIYTTTNLRTMESWTMPDSSHSCGGA